jgi:Family of unknown function (DUF6159)
MKAVPFEARDFNRTFLGTPRRFDRRRTALSTSWENLMATAASRSWDLIKQSFVVLKSDKEMMWLPVLSILFCLTATVIIFGIGFLLVFPPGPIPHGKALQDLMREQMTPFLFLFYVCAYSISTYFNVALVSIASNRLAGGHATLNDGLLVAWKRKWSILQWALLAATVGMVLVTLERRVGFLGRMVIRFTGFVWTLASFFVVPLLVVEDMGPIEALHKSAQIVRKRWGEEVVGGITFQLFGFLAIPALLLPFMGAKLGQTEMYAGLAVAVLYWLLLGIASSAAWGIFVAALYRYATEQTVPPGYDVADLAGAWQPKQS